MKPARKHRSNGAKRGHSGHFRAAPIFAEKVKLIVRMRDSGSTYEAIAKIVGGTRMGACSAYKRWREWGQQQ